VLKTTFFSPGLFKQDGVLWAGAWVFHAALALILIGHIQVGTDLPTLWAALSINADTLSATVGTSAGIIILLATLLYLAGTYQSVRMMDWA
jgi:nitrate reductase gamma subunit